MPEQTAERPPDTTDWKFPRQGAWTYDDWLKFPNDGWKYEIIDGELYMTPGPTPAHQRSSISLAARMYIHVTANGLGEILEAPCDVYLPGQPVPVQPDILFIHQERLSIIANDGVRGVPDLIVEILSPTNAGYDRERKFRLYEKVGVPEYWLVDNRAKMVEVYVLDGSSYRLDGKYGMGDTAVSRQIAGFQVAVDSIIH